VGLGRFDLARDFQGFIEEDAVAVGMQQPPALVRPRVLPVPGPDACYTWVCESEADADVLKSIMLEGRAGNPSLYMPVSTKTVTSELRDPARRVATAHRTGTIRATARAAAPAPAARAAALPPTAGATAPAPATGAAAPAHAAGAAALSPMAGAMAPAPAADAAALPPTAGAAALAGPRPAPVARDTIPAVEDAAAPTRPGTAEASAAPPAGPPATLRRAGPPGPTLTAKRPLRTAAPVTETAGAPPRGARPAATASKIPVPERLARPLGTLPPPLSGSPPPPPHAALAETLSPLHTRSKGTTIPPAPPEAIARARIHVAEAAATVEGRGTKIDTFFPRQALPGGRHTE
jgi:hypothetical protein